MKSKTELKKLLKFTENLARESGKILLKEQKGVKIIRYKDRQDIATNADLISENYIIENVLSHYPNHSILSEERGEINSGSSFRWIIDPLDGTKEFSHQLPLFNVSITLQLERETIVGVVFRPADSNLYSAAKNLGSYHNGQRRSVSRTENLKDAFLYCYLPSYKRQKEKYDKAWYSLGKIGKYVYRLRGLSDANSVLSWLSHGGCDGYLNISNPQPIHDIAAGMLIAKEGGAVISDLEGKDIGNSNPNTFIAANNRIILKQILNVIS